MERRKLTETEVTAAIVGLDGWNFENDSLKKSVKFENFADAISYVNRVGNVAETADHHPDITFGWGYADILLTTHDRGGVTDVDIAVAAKIDAI